MRAKHTDEELIRQIKEGNKNVLVYLHDKYYHSIKKFIIRNGGSKQDADTLLQEALIKLWIEVSKQELLLSTDLKTHIQKVVTDAWRAKHEEVDLKNYIAQNVSAEKRLKRRLPFLIGFLIITGIALWWYLDGIPVDIFNDEKKITAQHSMPDTLKVKKEKDEKNVVLTLPKKNVSNQNISSEITAADTITAIIKDTALTAEKILKENNLNEENGNKNKEDIVVRKDMLLSTRGIKVIESKHIGTDEEKSLAKETAEKLNPEAKLPSEKEEQTEKTFAVEFWKSPINYKGYKFGKNKIVLYGIEEPELIKLYSLGNTMYMEYGQTFFELELTNDFQPFTKLNDTQIISQLKK